MSEKIDLKEGELWEVFIQSKKGLAYKHVGSVRAFGEELALQNARDVYTRRSEGKGIWIVKSKNIISIEAEDDFFEPNESKIYRHPSFYKLPEGVKNI